MFCLNKGDKYIYLLRQIWKVFMNTSMHILTYTYLYVYKYTYINICLYIQIHSRTYI
jgi:hypothetical protein